MLQRNHVPQADLVRAHFRLECDIGCQFSQRPVEVDFSPRIQHSQRGADIGLGGRCNVISCICSGGKLPFQISHAPALGQHGSIAAGHCHSQARHTVEPRQGIVYQCFKIVPERHILGLYCGRGPGFLCRRHRGANDRDARCRKERFEGIPGHRSSFANCLIAAHDRMRKQAGLVSMKPSAAE